jgi:hypothetical protein
MAMVRATANVPCWVLQSGKLQKQPCRSGSWLKHLEIVEAKQLQSPEWQNLQAVAAAMVAIDFFSVKSYKVLKNKIFRSVIKNIEGSSTLKIVNAHTVASPKRLLRWSVEKSAGILC